MNIKSNENTSLFLKNNIHSLQSRKDNAIQGIEKQIKNVQERMSKLSENKSLSPEELMDRQKQFKEQLDELNKKLMQVTMEAQQKEREKEEKKIQEKVKEQVQDEESTNNIVETNLISLSSSLKQVSFQNSMSTKMKGEARVLESEIKIDESRGINVKYKKESLSKLNSNIETINRKIEEKLNSVSEEINKGNKDTKVKDDEISEEDSETSDERNSKKRIDVHI